MKESKQGYFLKLYKPIHDRFERFCRARVYGDMEFRDLNGIKVEERQKNNFNMNQYNYGLSTYISHRTIGLYVKYDLNLLF